MAVSPAPSSPPKEVDMHVVVTFVQWYLLVGFALGIVLLLVTHDGEIPGYVPFGYRLKIALVATFGWFPWLAIRLTRGSS